jgi:hypothetical protein
MGAQSLEDYNPFENETKPQSRQSQPAVVQPIVQNLPPYNPSGQQYTSDNNGSGGGGGVTQISTAELQVWRAITVGCAVFNHSLEQYAYYSIHCPLCNLGIKNNQYFNNNYNHSLIICYLKFEYFSFLSPNHT